MTKFSVALLLVVCMAVLPSMSQHTNVAKRETQLTQRQIEFEEFFQTLDMLLWNSDSSRQYRRGWFGVRRPVILSRRNGEPSGMYRSFVEGCYGILCELGINGLINRLGRMLL